MSLRPRFLSTLVAIFALAGAATQAASCAFEPFGTEPPAQSTPCVDNSNCDDQNPCTFDECLPDGICSRTNAPDGPLAQQTAGDCRREDCANGAVAPTNDDADIEDDNEPCTTDSCSNGDPVHAPLANGTMCTVGTSPGNCAAGVCTVDCSPTKPCNDQNPCTEDSCNAGVGTCTFSALDGLPTPDTNQTVGDCKLQICQNGVDTPINDDADLPDDMNSCTQNVCTAGVPSNPGVTEGTPCVVGQPEVCDGTGACVQCNVPADCVLLPTNDDCQTRTCVNHMCGQTFTAMGTPISTQTAGDCKQVVCNGTGGTIVENLDTDLPEDNNSCTKNVCNAGVPDNPVEALNFVCGADQYCDGMGNCVGCNTADQCVGVDDFCKTRTCINKICGYDFTAAGTDLPNGQTSQDCKAIECDGQGNIITSFDSADKPVDGNQCTQDVCTAPGTPSNPFEAVNFPCNQTSGTVCNGAGVCKKADGAACAPADMDCLSGNCVDGVCCDLACGATCKSCNVPGNIGKCVNVPKANEDAPGCTNFNSCDGAGTCKKDDAQGCDNASECVSNFCIDGVCCASGCLGACRACNIIGSVGTCSPIVSGEDNVPANNCTGTKACDMSGVCKTKDGSTCTAGSECLSGQCFDGVCCDVACSGTCKSCNITGAVGICSNVASGQDDANGVPACTGANQSCDGMGTCKKEIAEPCSTNAECISGFCADNVCCNGACAGPCQACTAALKGSGSDGTCDNIAIGTDPQNECVNGLCDGNAACKLDLGAVCSVNAQCLSTFCVDGLCCNTACTDVCKSCGLTGMQGACSNVALNQDDVPTCSGTNQSCDGAGACKADNGQTCGANGDCLSNFCVDGFCCNTACGNGDTTDCQACSVAAGAAMNGTCAPLAASTTCRASAGICDVAETCDGSSTACPADGFSTMGTVCRAAADVCDVEETCSGSSAACPADGFSTMGTVCRAAADACDVEETCSGSSAACPADGLSTMGTVCRAAADACDAVETCSGSSAACPADGFSTMGTVCRAAADVCDIAETCSGSSAACPADGFSTMGTVCRAAADVCDIAETCDGSSAACPADGFSTMGTVCRAAADVCDEVETCSGSSAACPADGLSTMGTVCRAAADVCDIAETCDGSSVACPADGFSTMGTVCRASADVCDVDETCSGSSAACPADAFSTMGTVCRAAVGTCDIAETCSGISAACPADAFVPSGTECDSASCMGTSQVNADTCNGMGTCVDNGATPCNAGYACVGSTCKTSCTGDSDCATGYFCSSNSCIAQLINGIACTGANQCSSGNCVDDVCCDTACSDTCDACNVAGSVGTCSSIPAGQDDTNATMMCSGTALSCDGNGNCKSENGETCAMGTDCLSNSCVDDVCCDSACSGLCEACSAIKKGQGANGTCGPVIMGDDPDNQCDDLGAATCGTSGVCDGAGACDLYASGTICNAESCSMDVQTNADTCDGAGVCVDNGTVGCSPYICGASACKTTCAADTDCLTGYYCSSNSCVLQKAEGAACTGANECVSTFCVDDVCCSSLCDGVCEACSATIQGQGVDGTCGPIIVNTDPDAECAGPSMCDGAGMCN